MKSSGYTCPLCSRVSYHPVDLVARWCDNCKHLGREPERLSIWTVYDHPLDAPDVFVARRFVLDAPTEDTLRDTALSNLRRVMESAGLYCMAREAMDEPHIVETWL